MEKVNSQPILHFWFKKLTDKQHFAKDIALDEAIRTRFGATLEAATRCELFARRATPEGRLAEIIVLDQFSRNVYATRPVPLHRTRWPWCTRKGWWQIRRKAAGLVRHATAHATALPYNFTVC